MSITNIPEEVIVISRGHCSMSFRNHSLIGYSSFAILDKVIAANMKMLDFYYGLYYGGSGVRLITWGL
jgi:hypothetical protein